MPAGWTAVPDVPVATRVHQDRSGPISPADRDPPHPMDPSPGDPRRSAGTEEPSLPPLLEVLAERSSDAIALASATPNDPVIRIRLANPALTTLFGYEVDEVLGHSPDLLVGPETDLEALRRMQSALRGSGSASEDLLLHHRDGHVVPVRASYDLVAGADGVDWYLAVFHDDTEQTQAAAALWRTEEWAQALVGSMTDVILIVDDEATIRWSTPSIQHRLGWSPQTIEGRSAWTLLHPDDVDTAAAQWERMSGGPDVPAPAELRVLTADGQWRVMRIVATDLRNHPAVASIVISASDVTERAAAQDRLTEHAELLEVIARGAPLDVTLQKIALLIERHLPGAQVSIGVTNPDGVVRNRAAPTLPWDLVAGLDAVMADPRTERPSTSHGWVHLDLTEAPLRNELPTAAAVGLTECRTAALRSPGTDEVVGAFTAFLDAEVAAADLPAELLERACNLAAIAIERHRFEAALEHRANYDELTGLPNRSLLLQRVDASLRRAARHRHGVAVLFVDLDRFRVVNDNVGHVVGDRLLHAVTLRLTDGLRPGDTLGRFGGDEFMIVCNRVASTDDAVTVAERILESMGEPFDLDLEAGPVVLTASVGIAVSLDAGLEPADLVRNADVAMSRAKDQGRNRHAIYDDTIDLRRVERLPLEQALRTALAEDQLDIHLQPIVRLADGRPTHAEALVRWHRPDVGLVMPGAFIGVAEDSGLIVPIGWQVLSKACQAAAGWPSNGNGSAPGVAVNLSARQLAHRELVPRVAEALADTGLEPSRLYLEVTESALVHDTEQAKAALEEVKGLGVRVAIDDFGTGYATLDYLRQFSMADELKIDRSFIDGVDIDGSREQAIVAAAVSIGESIGVQVVAEGVETEEQAEALRRLGVELAQGYLFSRPVPGAELAALLG